MAALQPSPEPPSRIFNDAIEFENDDEIHVCIGVSSDVRIVQIFNKRRYWMDEDVHTLYIVDEDRRLEVYLPALYLP